MISVCMASYNGERFIIGQIMSILNQLSNEDELIISDDGSNDMTLEYIKSINDDRIKVYINHNKSTKKRVFSSSHYKVTKNFENALFHAKGDYIFLADQDDIWENNKVKIFIEKLKIYTLVISNYSVIDSNDNVIKASRYSSNPISRSFLKNLYNMSFHGCCMAFRRDLLNYVLPFPDNLISHDNWIGLYTCLKGYKIGYIELPLIKYRRHDNNVSPTDLSNINPTYFKIWYRFDFVLSLFFSFIKNKMLHE